MPACWPLTEIWTEEKNFTFFSLNVPVSNYAELSIESIISWPQLSFLSIAVNLYPMMTDRYQIREITPSHFCGWRGAGLTDVWRRWELFPSQLFTASVILSVKEGLPLRPPPPPPLAGERPVELFQCGLPLCPATRARLRGRWSPQCQRGERRGGRETSSQWSHSLVQSAQPVRRPGELTRATGWLWGLGNYQRGPTSRLGENQSGEPPLSLIESFNFPLFHSQLQFLQINLVKFQYQVNLH